MSKDISLQTYTPNYFQSLNQEYLKDVIKSEDQIKEYFNEHKNLSYFKNDRSLYDNFVERLIENSKTAEMSLGIPWELLACNSFVESTFKRTAKSTFGNKVKAHAYGIAQLTKSSITTLENITKGHYDTKKVDSCYRACNIDVFPDYHDIISGNSCSRAKKVDDQKYCHKIFRTAYLSKVFENLYLDYHYRDYDQRYEANLKGKDLIRYPHHNESISLKGLSKKKQSKKYLYAYDEDDAILLSAFHFYYTAMEIDAKIFEKDKYFLAKDLESPLRFMQIIAASYNAGPGFGRKVFHNSEITNTDKLFEYLIKKTNTESRKHGLGVSRCMALGVMDRPQEIKVFSPPIEKVKIELKENKDICYPID